MRERGVTVLEVTITLAVITVLLTAALGGIRAHQISVALEYQRLETSRAASSRLEELRSETVDLQPGARAFTPLLRGGTGTETIREIEPGLYEVEAVVVHDDTGVRASLTTLVAREGKR
jgi:hypothetical protein